MDEFFSANNPKQNKTQVKRKGAMKHLSLYAMGKNYQAYI